MSTTTTATATTDTTSANYIPRGTVETELSFYENPADNSPLFQYASSPPEGLPMANYGQPALKVSLTDIRGNEGAYTLDKDAFQVFRDVLPPIPYETFNSDADVERVFYPEVEKLLLDKVPGAHQVILFDHVIRRQQGDLPVHKRPLFTAHADQTARAAENRVRLYVKDQEKAERLLQGRYRIINVWKPINSAVQSCPLAFASASTVLADDLVPIEFRLPTRTGEIVGVRHHPDQRWMYWSGMEDNECVMLKCNDSREDVARQVPHSAFSDPRMPVRAKGRESIEVRALVFG